MNRRFPAILAAVSSVMMLALLLCACGDGYARHPEDPAADPATVEPRIHAMVGNAADCFDQGRLHEAFRILKDAETLLGALSPEEAASVATRDMFLLEVYTANIYSNYRDFACAARYYASAMKFAASPRDSLQTLLNISVMSSHSGDSLLAARAAHGISTMTVPDKDYQKYAVAVAEAYVQKYFGDRSRSRDLFMQSLRTARSKGLKLHSSLTPVSELYEYYSSGGNLDSMLFWLDDYTRLAETFRAPEMMADVNKGYWKAYTLKGDRENALKAYNAYFSIVDSIYNPAGFQALNSRYNEENLNRTNDRMMRLELTVSRQKIILSAIVAAIAVAALIWLLWRRARMSQRRIFFLNREIARQEAASVSDPVARTPDTDDPPIPNADTEQPGDPSASDRTRHSELMRSVNAVLADPAVYCDPEFSITVLARLVGSNSKYVSQAINDSTGMNFRSFINSLRIKVARSRLAGNGEYASMTIQAISESVGFRSTSNFVLAFKKVMGITPSAYQKLAKNSIDS
ncbi:MAG: helix-turn-helix domain-containing protein [Muribaculaceae bacterium]|nr:helix-turn-helix domain-containing protein [Muribaculaceae bacterium]